MTTAGGRWDAEVTVVGVGAMGSATCLALARRGVSVLGLERRAVGHDRGSSHGQSRLIRKAYYEHPDYVPLLHRAYAGWDALMAATGQALFHRVGLCSVGAEDSELIAGTLRAAAEHGLPLDIVDGSRHQARAPGLVLAQDELFLYEADAGWLAVEACVQAQAALASQLGAEIRAECEVNAWATDGAGFALETSRGRVRARRLVLTEGAWASGTLGRFGRKLKVHRNVLHWFGVDARPASAVDWTAAPCFAVDLADGFFYGFPNIDASGVKVAQHRPGQPVDDPDDVTREPLPDDATAVQRFVGQRLRGLGDAPTRQAVCLYEQSEDSHFIIGRDEALGGVVIGAGFSGHGFKFAPAIGEALADLALDGESALPIGRFAIDSLQVR